MITANQLYLAQLKISLFTTQQVVTFCLDKIDAWPPITPADSILNIWVDNFVDNVIHGRYNLDYLDIFEEFLINQINNVLVPNPVDMSHAEGC